MYTSSKGQGLNFKRQSQGRVCCRNYLMVKLILQVYLQRTGFKPGIIAGSTTTQNLQYAHTCSKFCRTGFKPDLKKIKLCTNNPSGWVSVCVSLGDGKTFRIVGGLESIIEYLLSYRIVGGLLIYDSLRV